ncbi:MAG: GxxExxY protein [Thermomicrobia bacterium]|nr:GxxExxY protein [Thermomicrobia bacterium]
MGTNGQKNEDSALTYAIIGAAMDVHRTLGPGFLEAVYEEALCVEMRSRVIPFTRQVQVSVDYKGTNVGSGRLDRLVDDIVIVELKAVDAIGPIHIAQMLSYLRITGRKLGLILNFNVRTLRDGGIERVALSPSLSSL